MTNTMTEHASLELHSGLIICNNEFKDFDVLSSSLPTSTQNIRDEYLVIPQNLSVNSKLVITMNDGSTYSANLFDIHKESKEKNGYGQTTPQWVNNENYNYKIKLTKSRISFDAKLLDWRNKDA